MTIVNCKLGDRKLGKGYLLPINNSPIGNLQLEMSFSYSNTI